MVLQDGDKQDLIRQPLSCSQPLSCKRPRLGEAPTLLGSSRVWMGCKKRTWHTPDLTDQKRGRGKTFGFKPDRSIASEPLFLEPSLVRSIH